MSSMDGTKSAAEYALTRANSHRQEEKGNIFGMDQDAAVWERGRAKHLTDAKVSLGLSGLLRDLASRRRGISNELSTYFGRYFLEDTVMNP